jgi:hypothetical protein
MKKTYYLLVIEGGVEPFLRGPYQTEDERDNAAKQVRRSCDEDDGLFYADIDETALLNVSAYTAAFFWED